MSLAEAEWERVHLEVHCLDLYPEACFFRDIKIKDIE
jgi:hypothetical protein